MTNADTVQRNFTLTWTLDASPAEVFRAWTDPDQLDWFYNPEQPRPSEPIELDLRVGGAWRQMMVVDETTSYVTGGLYREIVSDQKLVFSWGATDGWPKLDPDRLEESPLVTVALRAKNGRTVMTVHVELPAHLAAERVEEWFSLGIRDGWRDTVDRLAAAFERTPERTG
jgi:uncharacterized protein YndB with AHSA1/START domain